jgi:hypothetical protein
MEYRTNCWEYFNCGRGPNHSVVHELGVCPAVVRAEADGVNHGKNGGRFCWTIEGTLYPGNAIEKFKYCSECDFFKEVSHQEGRFFVIDLEAHHSLDSLD